MFFLFSRPRWVVPVLPKGELEVLLEAAIDLSKKGRNPLNATSLVCSVKESIIKAIRSILLCLAV